MLIVPGDRRLDSRLFLEWPVLRRRAEDARLGRRPTLLHAELSALDADGYG